MSDRFPITRECFEKLRRELTMLLQEQRPAVIKALSEARDHGDLSENSEYVAAKERQSMIEARIASLEMRLASAEIIEIKGIKSDRIQFGARVEIIDLESHERKIYRVLGDCESSLKDGILSISSPFGKALLGKRVGEEVDISTPRGLKSYSIMSVEYSL